MSNKKYIIYHGNCMDGAFAAGILCYVCPGFFAGAWPMSYDAKLPDELIGLLQEGDEITVIDFSLTHEQYLYLCCVRSVNVVTYDHHAPQFEQLEKTAAHIAGLGITAKCTMHYEKVAGCKTALALVDACAVLFGGKDLRALARYTGVVGDRDVGLLWHKDTPEEYKMVMARVNVYLGNMPDLIKAMDTLLTDVTGAMRANSILPAAMAAVEKTPHTTAYEIGGLYLEAQKITVERYMAKAKRAVISKEGIDVVIVNCTSKAIVSDLGNALAEKYKMPAICYGVNLDTCEMYCSVRSVEGCEYTANTVAKIFGGNGHTYASGCTIDLEEAMTAFEFDLGGV